jgi:hypothetical protein
MTNSLKTPESLVTQSNSCSNSRRFTNSRSCFRWPSSDWRKRRPWRSFAFGSRSRLCPATVRVAVSRMSAEPRTMSAPRGKFRPLAQRRPAELATSQRSLSSFSHRRAQGREDRGHGTVTGSRERGTGPRLGCHPDWIAAERITSFVGHPLMHRGEVLGVLGLFARNHRANPVSSGCG